MRKLGISVAVALALAVASSANAGIIAGWAQNDNGLEGGGFGFTTSSFPQAADFGSGSHEPANFDNTTDAEDVFTRLASFAGTTVNDLENVGSGGSFSFVGDTNNGAQSVFSVSTAGFTDVTVSWAQRGTGTGFDSRTFEYSTDGGDNWVDVGAFDGSSGALTSTWTLVEINLNGALDNNADAMFRITYDGATSSSGNNRWDKLYVLGVPEPASIALLSLGGLVFVRRRRS